MQNQELISAEHMESEYVPGPEGRNLLAKAGIHYSKNSYYKELPNMPGVIRLGKKYFVPRNIVERLANKQ